MTEHVHEWRFATTHTETDASWVVAIVKCRECGLERGPSWMERRLNATERLSADDVVSAAEDVRWSDRSEDSDALAERLDAYASALEGNDDEQLS